MIRVFPDPIRRGRHLRLRMLSAAALCLVMMAAGSASANAADAANGKALALRWCSACHLVAEDQPRATSTSLPSFYDMARDPGWTQENLTTFLTDPHPSMPDMTLGNTEIGDLAAYIASLAP
jgi:mono/diheme cytochrome c family protein